MKEKMNNRGNYLKRALLFIRIYRRDIVIFSVIFILSIYIGSILAYRLISSRLDTPIEVTVKKSNEQLLENYKKMEIIYKQLDSVIDNIKSRDEVIYKQVFGSEISKSKDRANEDVDLMRESIYNHCDTLSDKDLLALFRDKFKASKDNIKNVGDSIRLVKTAISKDINKAKSIPSIQPIFNPYFSKNITPAGMRVNPFYKTFAVHKGIDYATAEGTRVFATANGVVSQVVNNSAYGCIIVIDHKNHYTTTYAHLSKALVKSGRKVKRGDIIGYSGNSGASFLPHLHYEVKYKKRSLNPFDFLFGELDNKEIVKLKEDSESNIQSYD